MPKLPPRPCTTPRCQKMAVKRGKCKEHQPKDGWTKSNKGKSRHDRGYGYEWEKRRKRALERDKYTCQNHKKQGIYVRGTEVDHIIPKAQGGTDEDDNLQTLCKACHKDKTTKERSQHE